MGQSHSQQCGICERTTLGVFNEDNFIRCYRCGGVYCIECAGLSNSQYKEVIDSSGLINWYCQFCVIAIKRTCEVSY